MRYRNLLRVVVLTGCCTSLLAQVPNGAVSNTAQAPQQYGGSISGHVYCADTNAPARFARVMLTPVRNGQSSGRGGFSPPSTTALDGSFTIQNVQAGMYYVTAMVPGYVNPLSEVASADLASTDAAAQERVAKVLTPISVNGTESAHAEIRLERGAAVSGTVYYDDGSPAVNIAVSVQAATSAGVTVSNTRLGGSGFFGGISNESARTDDYGRYRITGLPSGEYVINASAQANSFGGFGREQPSGTLTVYAPKSLHAVDAKVYALKAGSEVNGVDISVPLAAFHAVSGSAESNDGHTLNAGSLTLTDDKDKTHSYRASLQHDGSFRFLYVPEGSYTLAISGAAVTDPASSGRGRTTVVQSYGNASQSVQVESGDVSNVVVQVQPTQSAASH